MKSIDHYYLDEASVSESVAKQHTFYKEKTEVVRSDDKVVEKSLSISYYGRIENDHLFA